MKEDKQDLQEKWLNLRTICAGVCASTMIAGLGLGLGVSLKENCCLDRNKQKYLDYKASVEHVEKLSDIIGQIKESSIEDAELKDMLIGTVLDERYTQKLYEKSLTQEDRDEIRDNEKEAEHASDVSKCGFAGGVLLSAISGMGILGCNYKLADIDMDDMNDDRELGD